MVRDMVRLDGDDAAGGNEAPVACVRKAVRVGVGHVVGVKFCFFLYYCTNCRRALVTAWV